MFEPKKVNDLISRVTSELTRLDLENEVKSYRELGLADPLDPDSAQQALNFIKQTQFLEKARPLVRGRRRLPVKLQTVGGTKEKLFTIFNLATTA